MEKLDLLNGFFSFYLGQDDSLLKGNTRVYKSISFLFPNGVTINVFYLLHLTTYVFLSVADIAFNYILLSCVLL